MIKKVDIQITDICNRRCKWCPMLKNSKNRIMPIEIMKKIDEIMYEYNYLFNDNFKLTFCRYNEPFMYPDILKRYYDIIKKHNFKFTINTNGDYLNEKTKSLLSFIDLLLINDYDGLNKDEALIKLITWINDINILTEYSESLDHFTIKYNNTTIEYFYNKPSTMNTRDRGGTLDTSLDLHWINKTTDRTSCDVIGNMISIDVNGDVYPCCDTCGMISKHKTMCCGNIMVDNFDNIWENIINLKIGKNICSKCTTHVDTVI